MSFCSSTDVNHDYTFHLKLAIFKSVPDVSYFRYTEYNKLKYPVYLITFF